MYNRLLVITDDRTMQAKLRHLQTQCRIPLDIAPDVASGLKELFFKQPPLVLMQKDIGGIPSDVIATQVHRFLDKKPLRLVLMVPGTEPSHSDFLFSGTIGMDHTMEHVAREILSHVKTTLDHHGRA